MTLNKNDDLFTFLKKFKISKGRDQTHTSMGSPAGSYYIQTDDNNMFYKKYIESLENNNNLHITEKHKRFSPILLDFDFRFNVINNNLKRLYTFDDILEIVKIYTSVLNEYINTDNYRVYILEKKNPSIYKDNIGKDGIHIIIPEIITKSNLQYIIRKKCLELMKPVFERIGIINDIDDIFDEAVIEKNNWLMYGSSKPEKESYEITNILKFENKKKINKIIENNKVGYYVKLFSLRNKDIETPIKIEKMEEIMEYNNIKTEEERKELTIKQVFKHSKNYKKNNNCDIEIIKKFVKILNINRSKSFESWIRVGWCLRNIDNRLLEDWIEFSKNSEKYEDGECEKKWDYMKDGNLGIGTLRMWANKDDPEQYKKIVEEDLTELLIKAKTGSHTDVARVIYQMYKHDFVCSNIKKTVWWQFDNHKWKLTDSGVALRIKMSTEVYKQFLRIANDKFSKALQSEDDDDSERLKKLGDKYSKIAGSLKNQTQKGNYLKECSELFYHDRFEEKLDSRCTLIGFENGVFDLETYEFRDGHPDDFISFSTNIDYIPYNENDIVNEEILTFIGQILPKNIMKEYFLKLFSSFLSGHIVDEKFHILTGFGSNGKSKIIELYQNSFGDYCGQFNVTLLTQKRVKSSDTNSELAASKGKRFMVLQEPSEDEKMNVGFMKELTGGDRIIARGLFKDPIEFKPQSHLVLTCNHLPNIPSDDGGTWRRLRVIEFISTFTDNPDKNKKNQYKIDTELSLKFDDWKVNFMSILIHYYKKYIQEGIYEPAEVLQCTKEYQKDNDMLKLYIDDRLTEIADTFITQSELYNDFRLWFKDSGETNKQPTKSQVTKYMSKTIGKSVKQSNVMGWVGYKINYENVVDDEDAL
jgi:P4 family phage/plasmid primase-like protien